MRRAAVLLALLLLAGACADDGDEAEPPPTELAPRELAAVATVGNFLFVHGGTPNGRPERPALTDAAMVNTLNDHVRILPTSPLPPLSSPAELVVTGGEVVVLGVDCTHPDPDDDIERCEPGTYAGAVYSPDDDAWASIAFPEGLANLVRAYPWAVGGTSDGRAVYVLGGVEHRQVWTYAVDTGEWTKLADLGVRITDACLAGDTVVVATTRIRPNDGRLPVVGEGDAYPDSGAAAYVQPSVRTFDLDGSTEWATSPIAPLDDHQAPPDVACSPDVVLLRNGASSESVLLSVDGDVTAAAWQVPSEPGPEGAYEVLWADLYFLFAPALGDGPTAGFLPGPDVWLGPDGDAPELVDPLWLRDRLVGWPTGGPATLPVY